MVVPLCTEFRAPFDRGLARAIEPRPTLRTLLQRREIGGAFSRLRELPDGLNSRTRKGDPQHLLTGLFVLRDPPPQLRMRLRTHVHFDMEQQLAPLHD